MIATKKPCPDCGQPMAMQGKKWVCMNEQCAKYLESKSESPLAEGLKNANL
jgi:ribosomal protein S27AE